MNEGYLKLLEALRPLVADPGLSAAVYTQTTDVEIEVNGLMTYDRNVIKVDAPAAAEAAARLYLPPPAVRSLVPTSQQKAQHWLYALNTPATKWALPEFDDRSWAEAPGGFGTSDTPGAVVGTVWNTAEIWLRRRFKLADVDRENVFLRLHHDEDADVYLNGVLAAKVAGYSTDYQLVPILPRSRPRCATAKTSWPCIANRPAAANTSTPAWSKSPNNWWPNNEAVPRKIARLLVAVCRAASYTATGV